MTERTCRQGDRVHDLPERTFEINWEAGNIDHHLLERHQALSNTATNPVCPLHRPHPITEPSHGVDHLDHALVGVVEPTPGQNRLVSVQHRDRVRCLVRIDTNNHLGHCLLLLVDESMNNEGGQCLFEQRRPLFSHNLV